ncbi:hypothetical protein ACJIZ3_014560 [Penstemon smallii]|uniref:DUF4283 domain-containing protein n=1 Tax=Penstemon smallii TaxID=265156 RepID=A0ABD3RLX8_9LAMI
MKSSEKKKSYDQLKFQISLTKSTQTLNMTINSISVLIPPDYDSSYFRFGSLVTYYPQNSPRCLAPSTMDISNIDFGKKINLTNVEEGFCLSGDDWDQINSSTDLILVGRILGLRNINIDSIRTILSKAWSPLHGIEVKQIGDGRLFFSFKHKLDLKKALGGGPWSYEKKLVVLNLVKPEDDPFTIDLN